MLERIARHDFRSSLCLCFLAVTLGTLSGKADMTEIEGVTRPLKDAVLSSLVPGVISAIHVREGDRVQQGDVVVELERVLHELEVKRRQILAESTVTVRAAEARVRTLKVDLDSTRRIHERTQSISKEEVEKKELEYELASADLEQAELDKKREGIELEQAVEQVRMRSISSPLSGTVAAIPREIGETCQPHQPLLRIVDTTRFYFVANIDARLVSELAVDQSVELTVQPGQTRIRLTGRVSFISPVVDPASGLQEVKVLFDNADGAVSPGISGTITLPIP